MFKLLGFVLFSLLSVGYMVVILCVLCNKNNDDAGIVTLKVVSCLVYVAYF